MPKPITRGERYMPGLDGLRAIAVLAVIAYHLNFDFIPGGLLGVGVFFTLSGYLITDILLAQLARGRIHLKGFWFARARRLLPALFVMLIIVTAWVTIFGPHQPSDYRGGVLSAVFYVNNWWLIFHDVSYFQAFNAPAPLNHLWSLSVEEQFYIVWPFLVMLGVALIRERPGPGGGRPRLALATLGLALVSMILMIVLYKPGIDPSRVYYGTDTRAMELLVGAALAMVWPSRMLHARITQQARRTLDIVGVVGLLTVFLMFWRTTEFSPFLYRGGFLLLSVATAVAVGVMAHPASRLGPIVGCRPMRWVGVRSYGIYLWHFPIIILTTPDGAEGADLGRAALQVAATFLVAAISWRYIEDPIRHGALRRIWAQWKEGRWRPETLRPPQWVAVGAVGLVLVGFVLGMAGVNEGPSASEGPGNVTVAETLTATETAPIKNRTTCKDVVLIGDSTSEGLVSADYLPDPKDRVAAQFARVGATTAHLEVSGARSIYERFEGLPNAEEVAQAWKDQGFNGCWVLALGTNEAANVAAGSTISYDDRIDRMMGVADGGPVLWVNVRTIESTGPYAEANMEAWDKALVRACSRYPNMRIYDWASDVKDPWFIDDGIHFTTPGYQARSRFIADALLEAFPEGGEVDAASPDDCLINPENSKPQPEGKKKGAAAASESVASSDPAIG
jgi:peptidoglycan/LPS O-acetylase OafA/YrhL